MFLITFVALCIASLVSGASTTGRIIGGLQVTAKDVPYQLSVEYKQKHICGGVILSARKALTTTSCVRGLETFYLHVRAGSSKRESAGQRVFIEAVLEHPLYNYEKSDYDIALLKTQYEFVFNEVVQPIALPSKDETFTGGAMVAGFGVLDSESTDFSDNLMAAKVEILSFEDCRRILGYKFNEHMVCAGNVVGVDACLGDRGAGLIQDGKLVGVNSWGVTCNFKGVPQAYTSVANLLDFVTDNL